jgi:peptidoglycan/LPS O-acetylase OafA/YrhL
MMRVEQLTFTRFLAAIAIVIYHYGKNIIPFNFEISSFVFRQANLGVSYFFVLSGFIMIIAYNQNKVILTLEYFKRRFARIYPVYFMSIILLLGYFLLSKGRIDFKGLILNITMIQAWIPGQALSYNFPAWSLSVEVFFYLLFPFLFNKIYTKQPLKKLVIPVLLIFVITQILTNYLVNSSFYNGYPVVRHDLIFYFPLMHLSSFLIGNIAGLYFMNRKKTKNYDWSILLIFIGLIILLSYRTEINYHNGMLALFFAPLMILISSNNGIITKVFNWKLLVFLGKISYGIYIFQSPIYKLVNGVFKTLSIDNAILKFYSALILLIIISAISYHYIEKPLRRKINMIPLNKNIETSQ